jgi:chromosome segregation and condensation protein ScpB
MHKFFPTVKNQPKPLTKRQLELLVAIAFGEIHIWQKTEMDRRQNWWHCYEHLPDGRDVDVTGTVRKLYSLKLVRNRFIETKESRMRIIMVTPRGQTIVDDACTDLP